MNFNARGTWPVIQGASEFTKSGKTLAPRISLIVENTLEDVDEGIAAEEHHLEEGRDYDHGL